MPTKTASPERPIYKRVLLKLSGQALAGATQNALNPDAIGHIVREILSVRDLGIEIAIVVGGGNIFRGNVSKEWHIERAEADNMGMLATVINGIMLRAALTGSSDHEVRVMSALHTPEVAEPFIRLRADRHLTKGSIVVLTAGIGQPYLTTDYASVQRAIELRCDAVLAAKNGVSGVFNADPKQDPDAKLYRSIGLGDAIRQQLAFMDLPALVMARDHSKPIHVFDFDAPGVMRRICLGEEAGTYLAKGAKTKIYEPDEG
ncbi:UMP kinase [Marivibrio halodurans]|uniref:Uridylate kinase n=1 Tax=Marivibrio halodurans TaxID=2039722 RepID=A0A8J7V0H3_9PROT|nr:UMP kinase [Marivibrio halodurans]MBP5856801.1 UMP kinase [Marivibrio halodurans]